MNFKRYHESKNLFDLTAYYDVDSGISNINIDNGNITYNARSQYLAIKYKFSLAPTDVFTISLGSGSEKVQLELRYRKNGSAVGSMILITAGNHLVITGGDAYDEFTIFISNATNTGICKASNAMLNTGTTALPYEPYSSEVWHDIPHYIHNTSTDTLTTLPAEIYANDTTATVGLKGNMVQSGTPTPDSPIMPQGTGDKTANLFDISSIISGKLLNAENGELIDHSNYLTSDYKLLSAGVYTLSMINEYTGTSPTTNRLAVYDLNKTFIRFIVDVTNVRPSTPIYTFTLATDCYIRISVRVTDTSIMLNTGSTALPYEPFGIKIPISSANTTTPVYLGEVQTTRKIKKLVLTEKEDWGLSSVDSNRTVCRLAMGDCAYVVGYCTHINWKSAYEAKEYNRIVLNNHLGGSLFVSLENSILSGQTVADFKSYLAQQYAAGTPVTIWYVLAEPETGIVNEPIRKIGDYADTVSGITIPTIAGENTISVGTALQPSEVSVNYHGWHPVLAVHERENGAWD